MSRFASNNDLGGTKQALTTTYKTILCLTAATATLTMAALYDLTVGTNGVPADNALEWDISRITAIGTGTAATPNPLQPAHRASGTVATVNHTAEPTVTAASSLLQFGMNQRASYRWVAAPNSEMIVPNTNLAGLAIRAKAASYVSTVTASALHEE